MWFYLIVLSFIVLWVCLLYSFQLLISWVMFPTGMYPQQTGNVLITSCLALDRTVSPRNLSPTDPTNTESDWSRNTSLVIVASEWVKHETEIIAHLLWKWDDMRLDRRKCQQLPFCQLYRSARQTFCVRTTKRCYMDGSIKRSLSDLHVRTSPTSKKLLMLRSCVKTTVLQLFMVRSECCTNYNALMTLAVKSNSRAPLVTVELLVKSPSGCKVATLPTYSAVKQ